MRRIVLDLARQEAGAEDVGQLDGLVEASLGVEELIGELAAAAEGRQADLGRRDLAVTLGLVSGEKRAHLVVQPLALGQRLDVRDVDVDLGSAALLLGLLLFVERRQVLVGERESSRFP